MFIMLWMYIYDRVMFRDDMNLLFILVRKLQVYGRIISLIFIILISFKRGWFYYKEALLIYSSKLSVPKRFSMSITWNILCFSMFYQLIVHKIVEEPGRVNRHLYANC